jgi:exopolyphosphatase / guanosine-5'-triphosphate,3'-diphosphate pyrophosphatase
VSARVAVIDVGSNSTRLLVADVDAQAGTVEEVARRSTVTRLGAGVDATGRLAPAAIARVRAALGEYRAVIDAAGALGAVAVLTSAVRDATDGDAFVAAVREDYGLDARELSGEEEARLTYVGATSLRAAANEQATLVVDIGGGSTELVVGVGRRLRFHASTQAGVVRQAERLLHDDPPTAAQLDALTADVRAVIADAVPAAVAALPRAAIAVAGTPISLAGIELGLLEHDAARVEGHVLARTDCERLLARLATMTQQQLRDVPGLHPDRAPAIVAGAIMLVEVLRRFGLDRVEVSKHDLLYGAALATAGAVGDAWGSG